MCLSREKYKYSRLYQMSRNVWEGFRRRALVAEEATGAEKDVS